MNTRSVYVNLWLEYPVDFARLERNAEQMIAYAKELNEADTDGYIRVWVLPFTGLFAHLDPTEDPDIEWLHQKVGKDLNTHYNKQMKGEYYVAMHPDTCKYGVFYKECLS